MVLTTGDVFIELASVAEFYLCVPLLLFLLLRSTGCLVQFDNREDVNKVDVSKKRLVEKMQPAVLRRQGDSVMAGWSPGGLEENDELQIQFNTIWLWRRSQICV